MFMLMVSPAVTVLLIVLAAIVAAVLTFFILRGKYAARMAAAESRFAAEQVLRGQEAAAHEKVLATEKAAAEQRIAELKESHEKALEAQKEALAKSLEAVRAQLIVENEKALKAREEALKKEAAETMKAITGGLDQQIKSMKEAFEAQKKTHTEETASIKTQFEETVKNLRSQTEAIGTQAVDLAKALRGQNKMQGIFGEMALENLLKQENLEKGRDYDTEFWLRDKKGRLIENDESGRRMRPDVALHFPDGTDILIDAKVSLSALTDYFAAETDEQRAEASARNLASVEEHIKELSGKEYQKYVEGRKTLGYVIMFIPNYGAYQLAKMEKESLFADAFKQNVLLTTGETLIPFLRLIRTAWVQKAQMENMAEIVSAAGRMVDRVALFAEKNTEVGAQLEKTMRLFGENTRRLSEGPQSIVKAARDVIQSGVTLTPGKVLPE